MRALSSFKMSRAAANRCYWGVHWNFGHNSALDARGETAPVVQAVSKEYVAAMLDSLERFTPRT